MAEQSSLSEDKRAISAILWDLVQTFSADAQGVAKKKAADQGYVLDRGDVPFEETLINLSRNRDILIKSIEDAAIPLLPLKIQNSILTDVRKVSNNLTLLLSGNDAVLPFVSAVDDLTASIWYSNLQNMSGEVLGLHEKLNQLKSLEKALRDLNHRAEVFKASEERANDGLGRLDEALISVEGSVANLAKIAEDANQQLTATRSHEQLAVASLASLQQVEKNATESAATARAASAEVDSLRARAGTAISELDSTRSAYTAITEDIARYKAQVEAGISTTQTAQANAYEEIEKHAKSEIARLTKAIDDREAALSSTVTTTLKVEVDAFVAKGTALLGEVRAAETARVQASSLQLTTSKTAFETETAKLIEKNKESLEASDNRSKQIILHNEAKTAERFSELEKLEDVIREKIRLATNFQLFHAFQTRQLAIVRGKEFWRSALFVCVGLSFVVSVLFILYLFFGHAAYNAAFYLKLSISIPIIYAIHFCSGQYSKERQLEEEYAFKGNISISLEPYRELVEKLIDKNVPAEAAKYSDFVIASIEKVFTSPTQQVLGDTPKKDSASEVEDTSKGMAKILGSVNDLIQSLSKFK